jgi:uncharacterized protein YkwD
MRIFKKALAVVALTAVGLIGLAEAAHADTGSDESAFLAKLNDLRASKGLPGLSVSPALVDVARGWSAQMAAAGNISHNPSLAAQAPSNWAKLGENVGMGGDVQGLHDAFVASEHHYVNMVDPQFSQVGIGVVRGGDGTIFVTVDFMAPSPQNASFSAPAPAPAAAAAAPATTPVATTSCRRVGRRTVCRTVRKPVRRAAVRRVAHRR